MSPSFRCRGWRGGASTSGSSCSFRQKEGETHKSVQLLRTSGADLYQSIQSTTQLIQNKDPDQNPFYPLECRHPNDSAAALQLRCKRAAVGHLRLVRRGLWSAAEGKGQREKGQARTEEGGEEEGGKVAGYRTVDQTVFEVLANSRAHDQSEYLRWYRTRFVL